MSVQSKPSSRLHFVVGLSAGSQVLQPTRLTADNRITLATRTKVRIGLTPRVASRIHTRPVHTPSPSVPRPRTEVRKNPSLSSLFKGNILVTRLSTAGVQPAKSPGLSIRPTVSWQPNRRKAMLSSVVGSSATLSGVKEASRQSELEAQSREGELDQSTESEQPKPRLRNPRNSLSLPPPSSKTQSRAEERISLKEACRTHEWVSKAREQLQRDWQRYLRLSNGVTVDPPTEPFFTYKYFLGRGNNHPLVKACFRCRGFWTRLKYEEDQPAANLVWTQSKIKSLFRSYPGAKAAPPVQVPHPPPIVCSVKISPKKIAGQSIKAVDIQTLGYDLVTQSQSFAFLQPSEVLTSAELRTHNKLEHNYHLANKKTLFFSMRIFYELLGRDPFEVVPLTFHIKDGTGDLEFQRFLVAFQEFDKQQSQEKDPDQRKARNVWIVKPGENTNRGTGINVYNTLDQIRTEVSCRAVCPLSGQKRTFILQKYIENPLLIHKRKFDIRCYGLVTAINGTVQGYYYKEGYLRTSCKEFSLKDVSNRFVHLTNDAVQKHCEDYGKFESGNKLSYSDFQRYLDSHYPGVSVTRDILPQIRSIVRDTFAATFAKIDANNRLFSFEVLGYDFMVDSNMKVWLIEANTNPCLELSSPLLARIIPSMLDNAFRIAVDPYFPEPISQGPKRGCTSLTGEAIPENRFELVFHSHVEGSEMRQALGEDRFRLLQEFDMTLQDMPEEEELEESDCESEDGC